MNPFPFTLEAGDYTPLFPNFQALDVVNETQDGVAVVDTFDVPAAADGEGRYRYNLSQRPLDAPGLTVTVDGDARTVVPYGEAPAAGEVAVSFVTGAVEFHASDVEVPALEVVVSYTGGGTPLMGYLFHALSAEMEATQTAYAAGGGPVKLDEFLSRNPRVLHVSTGGNDTSGNGSIAYPYATIKKVRDVIVASAETAFVVYLAPGTYAMTRSDYGFGIVFTKPVILIGAGKATLDIGGSGSLSFNGGLSAIGVRFELGSSLTTVSFDDSAAENVMDGCTFVFEGTGTTISAGATSRFEFRNCTFDETGTAAVSLAGTNAVSVVGCTFRSDGAVTISGLSSGDFALFRDNTVVAGTVADLSIHCPIVTGNKITAAGGEMDFRAETAFSGNRIVVSGGTDTFMVGNGSLVTASVQGNFLSAPYFTITAKHIEGNTLLATSTTLGPGGGGLIALSPPSGGVASVIGNVINSTIPFQEDPPNATTGLVMAINRFSGAGVAIIEGNVYTGKSIFLMNSHPSQDAARHTEDRDVVLRNNYATMDKGATDGPDDVNAVVINYGRGRWTSQGNTWRALLAASTKTDAHHACAFFHPQTTAGTQVVRSINDRYEVTLPAGTVTVPATSTPEKLAIGIFNGAENRFDGVFVGPSISVDGNQLYVFGGLGDPKVVIAGMIDCNATVTYQAAPAGSKQVVRGDVVIAGNLTATNLSGTNTGDQTLPVGANPSGTAGLSAVNGAATSFMRSDAAPAISQSIAPSWTAAHNFTAGLKSTADKWTDVSSTFAEYNDGTIVGDSHTSAIAGTAIRKSLALLPGTKIKAIRAGWNGEAMTPAVLVVSLQKRQIGNLAATSWTTVEADSVEGDGTDSVLTLTLATPETVAENYEYAIAVGVQDSTGDVYGLGWQTSERHY